MAHRVRSASHQSKSDAEVPEQEERPSDQPEPGHAPRDEAGAVHQVAEYQPVPEGDDESGAEQEGPVLERCERDGRSAASGRVVAQADDPEHEDDPGRNEDALDDLERRRSRSRATSFCRLAIG